MDQIETLYAEHRQIRQLTDRLGHFIARDRAPDPVQFLYFRREFGGALTRHLKKEDWLLYPRLKSSSRPEIREVAARLCDGIGAFQEAFGSYARRWTSAGISEDWAGYRADTNMIIRALHRGMALEETELYPLLSSDEVPRLRLAG